MEKKRGNPNNKKSKANKKLKSYIKPSSAKKEIDSKEKSKPAIPLPPQQQNNTAVVVNVHNNKKRAAKRLIFAAIILACAFLIYLQLTKGILGGDLATYALTGLAAGGLLLFILMLILRKDIRERLFKRKPKSQTTPKETTTAKPITQSGKLGKKSKAAIALGIIIITLLVVLKTKNIITSLQLQIIIASLAGAIITFAVIRFLKSYKQKMIEKEKEEKKTIEGIEKEISKKSNKYETEIDKLYMLIEEKEKITLNEVAKGFKIDSQLAEEWARILENHDLIDVNHPAFGEVELCKKKLKAIK